MTTPQVFMNAQDDLEAIIGGMRAAFHQWENGRIDADEYGEKITDFIHDLDDYRREYAPTDHERFAQGRDHAEELAQDVFRDAQEDRLWA